MKWSPERWCFSSLWLSWFKKLMGN